MSNAYAAGEVGQATALRRLDQHMMEAIKRKRQGHEVNRLHDDERTPGQRVADAVAAMIGSWPFIIAQSLVLAGWIALNVTGLLVRAWDPYPFILLNLVLSFQAAYAAPIIMMSQNRQAAKDRRQAELDLQTNLKAEALIEELHRGLDDLRLEQWVELLRLQQQQIDMLQAALDRLADRPVAPAADRA